MNSPDPKKEIFETVKKQLSFLENEPIEDANVIFSFDPKEPPLEMAALLQEASWLLHDIASTSEAAVFVCCCADAFLHIYGRSQNKDKNTDFFVRLIGAENKFVDRVLGDPSCRSFSGLSYARANHNYVVAEIYPFGLLFSMDPSETLAANWQMSRIQPFVFFKRACPYYSQFKRNHFFSLFKIALSIAEEFPEEGFQRFLSNRKQIDESSGTSNKKSQKVAKKGVSPASVFKIRSLFAYRGQLVLTQYHHHRSDKPTIIASTDPLLMPQQTERSALTAAKGSDAPKFVDSFAQNSKSKTIEVEVITKKKTKRILTFENPLVGYPKNHRLGEDYLKNVEQLEKRLFVQTEVGGLFNDTVHPQLVYSILGVEKTLSYFLSSAILSLDSRLSVQGSFNHDFSSSCQDFVGNFEFARTLEKETEKAASTEEDPKHRAKKAANNLERFMSAMRENSHALVQYYPGVFRQINDDGTGPEDSLDWNYDMFRLLSFFRQYYSHRSVEGKDMIKRDNPFDFSSALSAMDSDENGSHLRKSLDGVYWGNRIDSCSKFLDSLKESNQFRFASYFFPYYQNFFPNKTKKDALTSYCQSLYRYDIENRKKIRHVDCKLLGKELAAVGIKFRFDSQVVRDPVFVDFLSYFSFLYFDQKLGPVGLAGDFYRKLRGATHGTQNHAYMWLAEKLFRSPIDFPCRFSSTCAYRSSSPDCAHYKFSDLIRRFAIRFKARDYQTHPGRELFSDLVPEDIAGPKLSDFSLFLFFVSRFLTADDAKKMIKSLQSKFDSIIYFNEVLNEVRDPNPLNEDYAIFSLQNLNSGKPNALRINNELEQELNFLAASYKTSSDFLPAANDPSQMIDALNMLRPSVTFDSESLLSSSNPDEAIKKAVMKQDPLGPDEEAALKILDLVRSTILKGNANYLFLRQSISPCAVSKFMGKDFVLKLSIGGINHYSFEKLFIDTVTDESSFVYDADKARLSASCALLSFDLAKLLSQAHGGQPMTKASSYINLYFETAATFIKRLLEVNTRFSFGWAAYERDYSLMSGKTVNTKVYIFNDTLTKIILTKAHDGGQGTAHLYSEKNWNRLDKWHTQYVALEKQLLSESQNRSTDKNGILGPAYRNFVEHLDVIDFGLHMLDWKPSPFDSIDGEDSFKSFYDFYTYVLQRYLIWKVNPSGSVLAPYKNNLDRFHKSSRDFMRIINIPFGYCYPRYCSLSINNIFNHKERIASAKPEENPEGAEKPGSSDAAY